MAGNFDKIMDERKELVNMIIENMNKGFIFGRSKWDRAAFQIYNPVSNVKYKGINKVKLYMIADKMGYQDNRWMTFKQAKAAGYKIKQGAKGVRLEKYIFEKQVEKENPDTGEIEKTTVKLSKPMINTFIVFNGTQIEGLPAIEYPEPVTDSEVWKTADQLIASSECPITEIPQPQAFYSPSQDTITLPPRGTFISPEAFATTLVHEMVHSTGHESRLNRSIVNSFGSPEYALEELRAELGAFFMASDLGLEGSEELLDSHTVYLKSWIQALENDPNELFRAAADAQKAVERLTGNLERYREQLTEAAAHQDIATLQQYEQFTQFHNSKIASLDAECKSIVINAFGGPGSGKSVSCMDICQQLKKLGYNAEYVQEYAKELVYAEDWETLDGSPQHQFEILKEQLGRIDRLYGKVDFIVTDSPILLNGIYNRALTQAYDQMITSLYKDFENFTYFVERDSSSYQQEGRIQDLAESQKLDQDIKKLLGDKDIYYGTYNHDTIDKIVNNSIATYNRINNVVREAESLNGGDEMLEPEVGLEKKKNMSLEQIEETYGSVDEYTRVMFEERNVETFEEDDLESVEVSEEEYEELRAKNPDIPQKVAIESTVDYADPEIGFVSVATDNMPAGTKYRLVTFGDKGNLVPYQEPDVMYLNREKLQDYIEAHKDALEVVNYDDMVYQAGKLKSEYTTQQHEMIEHGLHSFEFEDGYLHFSLDVNGYSYDGLYRIYDPVNGKSREIVNFNDYDPVIKENWDFIKHRLTQYVNEHPEIGVNGEQIPREQPSIYCEWSEHGAFRENTVYTPSEFSRIMEESDNEWIKLRDMELQQYGKDAFDILMEQGLPQHQTYAKVKYEIYIPGMEPLTVRQDIGDGFGSVYSFLRRNDYKEYANKLVKNMSDAQIQERLNYIHTNYASMIGDIQKFARFEIDDLHGEQSYRALVERRNLAASLDTTVKTNHGDIPLIDYLDIKASQYGFDSYEELLDEGMSIGQYSNITKEVIQEWKNMNTIDDSIDRVMEQMELQAMEPELDLEL